MAIRTTAPLRLVLTSLAAAGAIAGTAGSAAAQYYYYYEDEAFYPRGYYERYAPRPPARVPQGALGRIAARDYGLVQIDRTVRTGSSYVIDGQRADGRRTRLIIDAYSGELIDSIRLPEARRDVPRVARVDPRQDERPAPRLVPRPPDRPPSLKPPGQAAAPATVVPPSPAAPPRAVEPDKPAQRPPAEASAPATLPPAQPATPAAPTQGPKNPATGADKPTLVNPQDVRGTGEAERKPPLARAEPKADASGITVAPVILPPVQLEDSASSKPRSETPAVPVAPLD